MNNTKIAIIGIAYRLPGNIENDDALWDALSQGKDLVSEVDESRFDKRIFFHNNVGAEGKSYTFDSGGISDVELFDAAFFNISSKEASSMDPQQRILLELSWNAIENAGLNAKRLKGTKCGVYVGMSHIDYELMKLNDLAGITPYSMTGLSHSIAANRISYFYDLKGPSMAIDTACSSSLVALHQACSALRSGEIDSAIAGGCSLHLHPSRFVGFSKASMLSPDGRCKSFDESANGYVRSEGCIVLLLKPLDKAVSDGDFIRGVILNSSVNNDGKTNGLPYPNVDAQYELLKKVYSEINLQPEDIAYLESHGPGTKVGDPIELEAISKALCSKRKTPLPVGSVKSNIGHLEAAAGMAGLIKAVLCIEKKQVPANINLNKLNTNIDFKSLNIKIVDELYNLKKIKKEINIGINSFGFGGTNAHVIVSGYNNLEVRSTNEVQCRSGRVPPLLITANSETSLQAMVMKYADFIKQSSTNYYQAAYNLYKYSYKHKCYSVFYGNNEKEILSALNLFNNKSGASINYTNGISENRNVSSVLVYSGNGSQWFGMGKELLEGNSEIETYALDIDEYINTVFGYSILDIIKNNTEEEIFKRNEIAQPALFLVQVVITRFLQSRGVIYGAVIGHSVGEITAAWACGALSVKDATRIIYARSLSQKPTKGLGKMCVIGLNFDDAQVLLDNLNITDLVEIAGISSPQSVSLSGDYDSLIKIQNYCINNEIFFKLLDLDYPFHSKFMERTKNDFFRFVGHVSPKKSNMKFISTVFGKEIVTETLNEQYWWKNIRQPVKFEQGIDSLLNNNFRMYVEIGPHPILLRNIQQTAKKFNLNIFTTSTLRKFSDELYELNRSLYSLWGAGCKWNNNIFFPEKANKTKLPCYSWDKKRYWYEPTIENRDIAALKMEHPLLGWRKICDETIWENHLDISNCDYIKDHMVGKTVVFPEAAYIEMVIAANSIVNDNSICHIENFIIKFPLIVDGNTMRLVQFRLDKNGSFLIRSKVRLSEEGWINHVAGRLILLPYYSKLNKNSLTSITIKHNFCVSGDEHYKIAREIGLNYGNSFQTVNSVKIYDQECYANLGSRIIVKDSCLFDPTLIDGGLQAIIPYIYNKYSGSCSKVNSYLAVGVESITASSSRCDIRYAKVCLHSVNDKIITADVSYYDKNNQLVMLLTKARFKKALTMVNSDINYYEYKPYLLKPLKESYTREININICSAFSNLEHSLYSELEEVYSIFEHLFITYLVLALKKIFPDDTISTELYSPDSFQKLHMAINILLEEEFISKDNETGIRWNYDKEILDVDEILKMLIKDYSNLLPLVLHAERLGDAMHSILLGDIDPQHIFTEQSGIYDQLITDSPLYKPSREGIQNCFKQILNNLKDGNKFSVLEIGSGIFFSTITDLLTPQFDNFEYTLITFDEHFGNRSIDSRFKNFTKVIDFKENFNNCVDKKYNLILCSDIRFISDIQKAFDNINSMLYDQGLLIINDCVPDLTQYFFDGLKPYYYKDFLMSIENHSFMSLDNYNKLIEKLNYKKIKLSYDFENIDTGRFSLVLQKNEANSKKTNIKQLEKLSSVILLADKSEGKTQTVNSELYNFFKDVRLIDYHNELKESLKYRDADEIVLFVSDTIDHFDFSFDINIINLVKYLSEISIKKNKKLTLLTSGGVLCNDNSICLSRNPKHASLWGLMRVLANESADYLSVRMIDIQTKLLKESIDVIFDCKLENLELILSDDSIYGLKLFPYSFKDKVESDDIFTRLEIPYHGSFNNLTWKTHHKSKLLDTDVEVQPYYSGLNFRDVMYTLGIVPEEALENCYLGPVLGLEMAGVIKEIGSKVQKFMPGDKVFGFSAHSFSDLVITNETSLYKLPELWSFEEGATVPTVCFTAYYSLVYLARLRKGEKLLIHGAAGGVGLAALQIASFLGAEVYGTAGSHEKRSYLKLLGNQHIYDSRSLFFYEEVLDDTGGKGVDVVLNCLAGEAINASIKLLKPFGRFIELGKRDIYENNSISMKYLKDNISYFCVDTDQLMLINEKLTGELFDEMMNYFEDGILKPLPYRVFSVQNIKNAFKYMQQGKHIGKILIDLNSLHNNVLHEGFSLGKASVEITGTYLVTGGTSGLGLEIAKWLCLKGIKKLILISRKGVLSKNDLKYFYTKKIKLTVKAVDITSYHQLKILFEDIGNLNELKGIIHTAALYKDDLITNMSEENYTKVFMTKAAGAYYLDKLSLNYNLDNFIVLSSVSTYIGNIGQGNYVAGNAYMESLINNRRLKGLKGKYIAFGPIADTGLLKRDVKLKNALSQKLGTEHLSLNQVFNSLDKLLADETSTGVSAMDFNVQHLSRILPLINNSAFDVLRSLNIDIQTIEPANFKEYLRQQTEADARNEIKTIMQNEIAALLSVSEKDIMPDALLIDLGFDSLMGFQLAVTIEKKFAVNFSRVSFAQISSLNKITDSIYFKISSELDSEEDLEESLLSKHK
ncbi:MAG TPA: SDR family NAD(P)-dependent oxidoreductase [Victivallales bacterium]|nr:SDR family NAD(P)-dependent oxidoreductase [Victivallales bacterium]